MRKPPRFDFRGFTLVELLVTLGLIVILMSGVAFVFSAVSRSASAGQTISEQVRDIRGAQGVMADDFKGMVPSKEGMPLVIRGFYIPAFSNAAEMRGDRNFVPTAPTAATILDRDLNNDGDEVDPGEAITNAYSYDSRNHRIDTITFFARSAFARRTGNPGTFIDSLTSNEAYVNYGHLVLPSNQNPVSFIDNNTDRNDLTPGFGSVARNPNNYFANQFVLGRNVILLVKPTLKALPGDSTPQSYVLSRDVPQVHFYKPVNFNPPTLKPLGIEANASYRDGGTFIDTNISDTAYDVAGTTLDEFKYIFKAHLARLEQLYGTAVPPVTYRWWGRLNGSSYNFNVTNEYKEFTLPGIDKRFRCVPFLTTPSAAFVTQEQALAIATENVARTGPQFLNGCSQFIVEYAGDFLRQDSETGAVTGSVLNKQTDGEVDFAFYDPDGTGPATPTKQIRWYGLPRDTGGLLSGGVPIISQPLNSGTDPSNCDVVPLSAVLTAYTGTLVAADFEKSVPAYPTGGNYGPVASGDLNLQQYVAAWGPNDTFRPKMIRIVITLDERSGANTPTQSQTFEFVFEVP